MALFDIYTTILAYEDSLETVQVNSPNQKFVDWTRKVQRTTVSNPSSSQVRVGPQETIVLFDGKREIATDAETVFKLEAEGNSLYTLSYVSGPSPNFRTSRDTSDVVGKELKLKVNKNTTITISCDEEVFGNIQSGDVVLLSNVFGPSNKGRWIVISVSDKTVHLRPPLNGYFGPRAGSFTTSKTEDFIAFSADGVQAGDKLALSEFPGVFEIRETTDSSLRFYSSSKLPETETQGIEVYEFSKKYVRVETNNEVDVSVNNQEPIRISPLDIQEFEKIGWIELTGPIHSLSVTNKENTQTSVTLIAVE